MYCFNYKQKGVCVEVRNDFLRNDKCHISRYSLPDPIICNASVTDLLLLFKYQGRLIPFFRFFLIKHGKFTCRVSEPPIKYKFAYPFYSCYFCINNTKLSQNKYKCLPVIQISRLKLPVPLMCSTCCISVRANS